MGAITGTIDEAALTRLARGVGAVRLAALDEVDDACLQADGITEAASPIELRRWEPDDDDDTGGYRVHAAANDAIAHRDAKRIRWTYAGVARPDDGRVVLRLADRDWDVPAGAAVRVIEHPDATWAKAIVLDGGDGAIGWLAPGATVGFASGARAGSPIGVFVGFDAEEDDAVAIVLDAAGLGGLRDDRDGEEGLRAAHAALADLPLGASTIPSPRVFEGFVPHLTGGAPPIVDYVIRDPVAVTAAQIGTLALPSRTIGLVLGGFHIDGQRASTWPLAGDRVDVIGVTDARGDVVAWMLRVPDARAARWAEVGFEDTCVVGDGAGGGGTDDAHLRVVDGGWPGTALGFATSVTGATLLCVRGLDLSQAHGFVGLDDESRLATLVVIA